VRLLQDDAEWLRCSAAGAKYVEARFSVPAMRAAIADAFGLEMAP
jgi:hypothetical protein